MRRTVPLTLVLGLAAASLVACSGSTPRASSTSSTTPAPVASTAPPPSSTASPTPPATPASPPPTVGAVSPTCVHGWLTPPAGSPRFTDPVGIIRRTTGVTGPLVVVDMRYFTGGESPPSDQGYLLEIERWYVKLYAQDDLSYQGRFLVEARRFGRGVAAVAPYDTHGFGSPDWFGFQFESDQTVGKAYPGLPGTWSGTPYDFVEGGAGLTFPGLPADNVGCLDGT